MKIPDESTRLDDRLFRALGRGVDANHSALDPSTAVVEGRYHGANFRGRSDGARFAALHRAPRTGILSELAFRRFVTLRNRVELRPAEKSVVGRHIAAVVRQLIFLR